MGTDGGTPEAGRAQEMEPGIRRILAPNPSPMTGPGTNTYLVGTARLAVIDPGPESPAHLDAILGAVGRAPVEAILVTHSHLDHSPLARPLSRATGAPVMAFGDSGAGRAPDMEALARDGLLGGGEGVDAAFRPHECLADGTEIGVGGLKLTALHTPGHFGNHMCFSLGDVLFTGDHVMGWASSLVSPPDGDLTAFMASCERLARRDDRVFHSGHGAPVGDPAGRLDWLVGHRRAREAQIMQALREGADTAARIVRAVYTDTPETLLPAARRNVLAHLIDLHRRGLVTAADPLGETARFRPG